jgi:hypothetical protein
MRKGIIYISGIENTNTNSLRKLKNMQRLWEGCCIMHMGKGLRSLFVAQYHQIQSTRHVIVIALCHDSCFDLPRGCRISFPGSSTCVYMGEQRQAQNRGRGAHLTSSKKDRKVARVVCGLAEIALNRHDKE